MKDKVRKAAMEVIEKENFASAVKKEVVKLKWPLWRKLFPYKITIKVKDLRKED